MGILFVEFWVVIKCKKSTPKTNWFPSMWPSSNWHFFWQEVWGTMTPDWKVHWVKRSLFWMILSGNALKQIYMTLYQWYSSHFKQLSSNIYRWDLSSDFGWRRLCKLIENDDDAILRGISKSKGNLTKLYSLPLKCGKWIELW